VQRSRIPNGLRVPVCSMNAGVSENDIEVHLDLDSVNENEVKMKVASRAESPR